MLVDYWYLDAVEAEGVLIFFDQKVYLFMCVMLYF